jgi:DNA-binding MurR/RpiR family transcriptional regulator
MKGLFRAELTSVERFTKANQQYEKGTTLHKYCENAIRNLENLMISVSETELKRSAQDIYEADRVFVVGYRASGSLALHLGYLLGKIRGHVVTDTNLSWELMDSLNTLSKSNKSVLMVVIAFPRYPLRTIEIIKYAKKCDIKIFAISDYPGSPIISLADQYIIIDIEGVSYVEPFAHVIAFLGALVHEVTFLDNAKAKAHLANFDKGVKATNEFFTEASDDQKLEYNLQGSKLNSLWPQK